MVADKGRRKFLGGVGAAALASGLASNALAAARQEKSAGSTQKTNALRPFGFVIHGGAGTIERSRMTPEREKAYRDKLTEALRAGYEVLNRGAGTSTGGMTNKRFGRVGDSPIIGAGTYANNETCAVSCTGDGEYFIRSVVAHDISAQMQYGGRSLAQAAESTLEKVAKIGGTGGLIGIDRQGNFAMPFNTSGMYRGWIGPDAEPHVLIYGD